MVQSIDVVNCDIDGRIGHLLLYAKATFKTGLFRTSRNVEIVSDFGVGKGWEGAVGRCRQLKA
jgi:hypothetical protein